MSLLEQHVLDNLVFLRHADLQATAVEAGAPPTEDPIQQRRRKKSDSQGSIRVDVEVAWPGNSDCHRHMRGTKM